MKTVLMSFFLIYLVGCTAMMAPSRTPYSSWSRESDNSQQAFHADKMKCMQSAAKAIPTPNVAVSSQNIEQNNNAPNSNLAFYDVIAAQKSAAQARVAEQSAELMRQAIQAREQMFYSCMVSNGWVRG
ncbi:hypothetical protein OQJ62_15885 [Microbulbifer thermotolerans]|uniref:hypothetical protein n=1 Tax=Microbulbifer thermotolerans TaxID=252514 RepID=UPI002249326E|nr:hypothetical protein [Microbulbifer thermotolerans]MCX2796405.1 hypothetical protein [Microbulbifer thermotolerans]